MLVGFINAASAAVETGVTALTITKPTKTAEGHLMVAAIAARPNTVTIDPPSGWKELIFFPSALATASLQAIYYKWAGASEPADYSWTLGASPTGAVGGICTFSGVDTYSPFHDFAALDTATSLSCPTPNRTTSIPNTFILSCHSTANADTWTPPGAVGGDNAMDERVDVRPTTAPICLEMNTCDHVAASATGAKTATDNGESAADSNIGSIVILTPFISPSERSRPLLDIAALDEGSDDFQSELSGQAWMRGSLVLA